MVGGLGFCCQENCIFAFFTDVAERRAADQDETCRPGEDTLGFLEGESEWRAAALPSMKVVETLDSTKAQWGRSAAVRKLEEGKHAERERRCGAWPGSARSVDVSLCWPTYLFAYTGVDPTRMMSITHHTPKPPKLTALIDPECRTRRKSQVSSL